MQGVPDLDKVRGMCHHLVDRLVRRRDLVNGDHTPLVIRECEPPTLLDGGTNVVLQHDNLPSSTGVGYAAGWHAYLDRLADQLSGSEITNWSQRFDELIGEYRS